MHKFFETDWILVDDSSNQMFRRINEGSFLYREDRICAITCKKFNYQSQMDFDDYTPEDMEKEVLPYYDGGVEEVKKIYGDDWKQIVLECIFEQEVSEREDGYYSGLASDLFEAGDEKCH